MFCNIKKGKKWVVIIGNEGYFLTSAGGEVPNLTNDNDMNDELPVPSIPEDE